MKDTIELCYVNSTGSLAFTLNNCASKSFYTFMYTQNSVKQ